MPYMTYKLMHFAGIFTMIVALSVTCMHVIRGGSWSAWRGRGALVAIHVAAAVLILTGGFGMLARLGFMHGPMPGWVFLKLAIWLALGGAIALPFASRPLARALLVAVPLLCAAAGAVALLKPF